MLYDLLRPLIFRLDPETAHALTLKALALAPARALQAGVGAAAPGPLAIEVAGLHFPNPLGLAAGFDKNAQAPDAMLGLGLGFVEVGSVTPRAQEGNPRPRLFRLVEDQAVINRMGFNNAGGAAAARRLAARAQRGGIVGVNIGANKDSPDRIADYAALTTLMAPLASYLAINVSSPNTPGLRALQDAGALTALIEAVMAARAGHQTPVFLKVAPDLAPADVDAIARIALEQRLGGLIIANTTLERPPLRSAHAAEAGGLSGAPLRALALARLRDFRAATGGAIPLVGVGGIACAEDAWARIRAGASLVQLYSALVYRGPGLPRQIIRGIEHLMRRDGFGNVAEAAASA